LTRARGDLEHLAMSRQHAAQDFQDRLLVPIGRWTRAQLVRH
jgi:hypothetical protein